MIKLRDNRKLLTTIITQFLKSMIEAKTVD